MAAIPMFPENALESICNLLGDTQSGLTGSEIAKYLERRGIADGITSTKRVRLFEALHAQQEREGSANRVIQFVETVLDPVSHTASAEWFETKRSELNRVLAFCSLTLGEDGKVRTAKTACTLTEAEQKADRLKRVMRERGVHSDVLTFCQSRLLEDNYFHAVLEASKSVAEKIRQRTGLTDDGAALVDRAFGFRNLVPFLAFSRLETETQQSEQTGLMNLMKGVFGAFRNPIAHEPQIKWTVTEQDAMDLLTTVSLLHRRIDAARRTLRTGDEGR